MGSREVYDSNPEFSVFPYESFPRRLSQLRSEARTKSNEGKSDHDALIQDRAHFPCPTHNANGVLRWEASEAEEMLKLDVSNHLHERMTPKELYHSRAVYQLYNLKSFEGIFTRKSNAANSSGTLKEMEFRIHQEPFWWSVE